MQQDDDRRPGSNRALQLQLEAGIWKVLFTDGPLFHTVGERIYTSKPPDLRPCAVWVDGHASTCVGAGPGELRTFNMIVRGYTDIRAHAALIMASVMGAFADARPDEYLIPSGYRVVGGVGPSGTIVTEANGAHCVIVEVHISVDKVECASARGGLH